MVRAGGYKSALDGLIIRNMHLLNAGSECVRLRGEYVCVRQASGWPGSGMFYSLWW